MNTNNANSSSHTKTLPLIKVLHIIHQNVLNFKNMLLQDDSAEAVQQVIKEMSEIHVDERLPENITSFIMEMVSNNDRSHESLIIELSILSEAIEEHIKAQQHEDNVIFMRTIMSVMLKHADEVASWMEEEFN